MYPSIKDGGDASGQYHKISVSVLYRTMDTVFIMIFIVTTSILLPLSVSLPQYQPRYRRAVFDIIPQFNNHHNNHHYKNRLDNMQEDNNIRRNKLRFIFKKWLQKKKDKDQI